MDNKIYDKIGQEILPESYIVYGHLLGRCAGLRIGKVLKTEVRTEDDYRGERRIYRITVRGVNDGWSHRDVELTSKSGTLQFPERIMVIADFLVPAEYKKLLDPIGLL